MSLRPILTKSAAPAKKVGSSTSKKTTQPKPVDKTARVHPMLTDTSPLTRQVCAAANLPDVQALLLALAHPMTDEDQAALAKKAGGHPAHATRVKHLRELALKQHGDPTTEETTEKSFPRGDLAKGTFWRKVDAMDFGGIKRIPRAIRGHGMGSKGGKVFVNGAGHLQYGEAPPPFQAHVSFNEENEHESHAVSGLRLHGVSEQEAGNHLLYQTGDERHALALATAAKTGGHPHTIERVYREKAEEAQRQFRAHPMHHMDDLVEFDEAGRPVHDDVPVRRKVAEPVYDNDGVLKLNKDGSPKTKAISVDATERRPRYLIKRDKAGERKYTKANQPLDPVDVAKVLKVWNNLPKETRETDAKWYTGEAKHWIQQVAEASGQPFLKVAALLAAGNQAMGWETGQIIAAQQTFHDTMGITDAKGEPRYLQGRFPAINERIQRIATTPNNRRDLVEMVKREFATDKLGNFLMNMVGAGDGRAATVDRHMLGILGARVDSKGDYVASTHDMAYYRRVLLAAAHQAGTTPEGIQAATWVYFRNNGAKEKARANGQPEYLIGTVEKNKNLPTMRAYIAQRLAEAREAKAAPRPMRPRTAPATIAAKSFRSHLASRHDSVYSEDMGKSERVQSPGSRGGKGYWDGTGTWRYGQRPTEQAPEASRLPQEPTGHEAGPSGPPASSEPVANPWVRQVAEAYVQKAGIADALPERPYAKLDTALSHKIADAYEAAEHNPKDPVVARSYAALAKEVKAQYEHALASGMRFTPWGKNSDPYKTSAEMREDVLKNKHLGFYQGGSMPKDHPLARVDPDHGLTVNDQFRAIHDLYGHAAGGYEFGPRGEDAAWREHRRMFTPEAIPALTAETRGQNSVVNFGSHLRRSDGTIPKKGESGYVPPSDRPFADQKAVVLPAWAAEEGAAK